MSVLIDLLPLIVDGSMEYFFKIRHSSGSCSLITSSSSSTRCGSHSSSVFHPECSLPTMTALGRASSGVRV